MKKKQSYTVYFASELFSLKHLVGNAYLAEAIYEKSHGRFCCRLPQDFELRGRHPHVIRDQDIRALLACDLALFNFDGTELDSGTVVEFMLAKFADIPSVILRTDLRSAGDQASRRRDPWNLMASFYPRTVSLRAESLIDYRILLQRRTRGRTRPADDATHLAGQHPSATAAIIC
ncbi:MAG TPA: nucleoside 2-deoxyribosyltransferase, partial [Opitutaceae bacterium]